MPSEPRRRRSTLRRVRSQLGAAGQLLRAAASDPNLRKDLLGGLVGRAPAPAANRPVGDRTLPEGLADYSRSAHASVDVDYPVAETSAFLADLSRFPSWLTMHAGWRGDPPQIATAGVEFTQQAKIMGIPADIRWTVVTANDTEVELRGQGPMGLVIAQWLTIEPRDSGCTVWFDAGMDGQPIQGPMGSTVIRSLEEALDQSLAKIPAAMAAAGPLKVRRPTREPVLHTASGVLLDPRTPVIVGVGQVVQRVPDLTNPQEPAALSATALKLAAKDSGAGESLLRAADAAYAVPSASWSYRNQAALVADAVGANPAETVQSSKFGGDGGQLIINDAAQSIVDGIAEIILLSGAESGATLAAAQRAGKVPSWTEQAAGIAPTRTIGVDRTANNDAETAVGLGAPIYVYSLLESAVRRSLGREPKEHSQAIGELWSRFSSVAARNPYAWQPTELPAADITTTSEDNRMVSTPYTKLLCANLQVDLATGMIMCSAAAAEEAGIAQDKWVFVHAGASAHDEWFVSERADLAASPAIRTIGAAVLEHSGLSIDDIAHVDLYACFPSAVQIAARELGLPADDPNRPLTVTGGLTFGGGPGNNYGSHAVATLVGRLREQPETYALSTSLGWYATKHAIGIYSATPPRQSYAYLHPVVENPPSRPVLSGYTGDAVVEAYTVPFARDGKPEAAVLSLLNPKGERVLVRTKQEDIVAEAVDGDLLGLPVTVASGDAVTITGTCAVDLPAPPPPPVLVERRGPITVITLNRPEVRNAINLAAARALEQAIDAFEAAPTARIAVLTGGTAVFSSGMDLKAAARGQFPITEKRGPLGLVGAPPTKPLIAAVEGAALAGGCELALAADLIVAADNSQFGIPEPKRGLVAAGGGVLRLRERLPRNVAMELALTGDPMPAARLAELGLVNRIAPAGKALEVALELAAQIAVNAPLSVVASKQIIVESSDWNTAESFERQTQVASAALFSEDATEGVRAFAEHREPVWRGR
ncbi:crotonase/enoyl-CoA hydratase family protein [Antrihabitans sp. YC2-6]|uniref:type II toxin-antitoxin system Rv0910 family toxin n=1 Tax=Antrihabitans sp. YC2-6 TaxID=2799498 RepID=UPI0018F4A3F8|nr:crotonase/enoyl-CoA hydratase family protein [Antrihabitans sp. YC2-6]MBJ8346571.1 crotonase/enoyl-CoA hydratase family protein [Antrihabitans sp. YC2-6]